MHRVRYGGRGTEHPSWGGSYKPGPMVENQNYHNINGDTLLPYPPSLILLEEVNN
jgi:hypothetical protein